MTNTFVGLGPRSCKKARTSGLPDPSPKDPLGTPEDPQGHPKTHRGTSRDFPRTSEDSRSLSKYTPSTSQDPPSHFQDARGPPKDPCRTTHDLQMVMPSIRPCGMRGAIE